MSNNLAIISPRGLCHRWSVSPKSRIWVEIPGLGACAVADHHACQSVLGEQEARLGYKANFDRPPRWHGLQQGLTARGAHKGCDRKLVEERFGEIPQGSRMVPRDAN